MNTMLRALIIGACIPALTACDKLDQLLSGQDELRQKQGEMEARQLAMQCRTETHELWMAYRHCTELAAICQFRQQCKDDDECTSETGHGEGGTPKSDWEGGTPKSDWEGGVVDGAIQGGFIESKNYWEGGMWDGSFDEVGPASQLQTCKTRNDMLTSKLSFCMNHLPDLGDCLEPPPEPIPGPDDTD